MNHKKSTLSSFRDPSGFVFYRDGSLYRQVNAIYKEDYCHLMDSGLYQALVDSDLLIPHQEITDLTPPNPENSYKIIQPVPILFISYPYEWCFSQLKDAALNTLSIQKRALDFGMTLKDCSAYNIQFWKGKPVLIDTLSFERIQAGTPWVAYRQFCQHFLAPLALMSYTDVRLSQLSRIHLDGIPLDLASALLPLMTRFRPSLLFHIHLHAKGQRYFAGKDLARSRRTMTLRSHLALVDSLESAVKRLIWQPRRSDWISYYQECTYSQEALEHKAALLEDFLDEAKPVGVWDLGANTGFLSRLAAERGISTLCFDMDPAAVEKNYLDAKENGQAGILPLLLDLVNPSPNIGWENQERLSFMERAPADTVIALALIHHLAISNNVPLSRIASFFSRICDRLIIEFVPKSDPQVSTLLKTRRDIFPDYTKEGFEREFMEFFQLIRSEPIRDSLRILYLMEKREMGREGFENQGDERRTQGHV